MTRLPPSSPLFPYTTLFRSRRQGRRYGAGLVCSEMVSCAGLEHRNERTLGYLRVARDEHPLAIQIFGSEPTVMAESALRSEEHTSELQSHVNIVCRLLLEKK